MYYPSKKECTYEGRENMTKTSEAQKKAVSKYDQDSRQVPLKYTPNQRREHDRLKQYCNDNKIAVQAYIKSLIKADLDAKGIPYPVDNTTDNMPD